MAKPTPPPTPAPRATPLFADAAARIHPRLFLPRFLAAEAGSLVLDTPERAAAHQILIRWADLADAGKLDQRRAERFCFTTPGRVSSCR